MGVLREVWIGGGVTIDRGGTIGEPVGVYGEPNGVTGGQYGGEVQIYPGDGDLGEYMEISGWVQKNFDDWIRLACYVKNVCIYTMQN